MTILKDTCAVVLASFATLGTASAHASLETKTAEVGSSYKAVMRVPHGCEGSATHTVIITVPEGFYNVKPMPKAGWTLETTRGAYEQRFTAHGREYPEGVKEITWSGGYLQDDWYDEFVFRGTFGSELAPDSAFHFPTVQLCEDGQVAWDNVTDDPDAGRPAPALTLVAGEMDHAGHLQGAAGEGFSVGDLEITDPFSFATLPNAPVAGGFFQVENTGEVADRLIAVTTAISEFNQVHEMTTVDNVMQMREVEGGLEIPAGETVTLAPGGFHIMFLRLNQALVEGETIMVTLTFENAGDIDVPFEIRSKTSNAHSGH